MVHILSFINYMYKKNKWMQRLHDNVSENWQKFPTMVYDINRSRDLKREQETTFEKKVFESVTMTEKSTP